MSVAFSNKGFEWPKATSGAFKASNAATCVKLNFNWCLKLWKCLSVAVKKCRGFDELRRKKDKTVWTRDESFENNRDEVILGFSNESWDSHFVTISHENQIVLLKILFGTFVRFCNWGSAGVAQRVLELRKYFCLLRVELKGIRFVLSELDDNFVLCLKM